MPEVKKCSFYCIQKKMSQNYNIKKNPVFKTLTRTDNLGYLEDGIQPGNLHSNISDIL